MSSYVKVEGLEGVQHVFSVLPQETAIRVERSVIGPACRMVSNAAKAISPVDKGLFRASQGYRIKAYRETNRVIGIVGSRRLPQYRGRANIAHLIEEGYRIARGGTLARESGSTAAASSATGERGKGVAVGFKMGRHVMQRAYASTSGQVRAFIESGIAKAVNEAIRSVRRA